MSQQPDNPQPWPFPQWNGKRWVMPIERLTKEQRQKQKPEQPFEEAPF
jgi:hypothetical protein